eukprot:349681-Chlamydomonas_euryale.AAC.2
MLYGEGARVDVKPTEQVHLTASPALRQFLLWGGQQKLSTSAQLCLEGTASVQAGARRHSLEPADKPAQCHIVPFRLH